MSSGMVGGEKLNLEIQGEKIMKNIEENFDKLGYELPRLVELNPGTVVFGVSGDPDDRGGGDVTDPEGED